MPVLKTIKEVSPVLRIAPVTVRRLIARGELPFTKVGKRYLFTEEHLNTFINRNAGNVREVKK